MSYRKFSADYLFDGYRLHGRETVLIANHEGVIQDLLPADQAGENVEPCTGLLSPGFINCHCHLELSHLRNRIPMKTGLVDFVFAVVSGRGADADSIQAAIESAESEMLTEGIVAVGDICNGENTLKQKRKGRLKYYNFIELAGWLPDQAAGRFRTGQALFHRFADNPDGERHLSLSPHAPYSVSPELWNLLKPGFPGKTITIHNQETAEEDEFFMTAGGGLNRMYAMMKIDEVHFSATGKGSLDFYLHQLKHAGSVLLVHNTYTSNDDLIRLKAFSPDLYCCLCPNANLYIENRLPDIESMKRLNLNLVVGTDSLASNQQLSILEELKTIRKNFPEIDLSTLLTWATSNGARALQFNSELGDFKRGKKPGILLIESPDDDLLGARSRSKRLL